MVVLVTGATGFIGLYLVNRLLEKGETVRIVSRNLERVPKAWRKRVQIVVGDVVQKPTLFAAVEDVDTVFHLAGEIHDKGLFSHVNYHGTRNLLEACSEKGSIRFLYLSSVGVLGARGRGQYDERSSCNPTNAYEQSKFQGELAALDFCYNRGLPVTVVRPTIVFGPRSPSVRDSFLSWMRIIKSGRFRFIGSGNAVANYVYVEDVVESCIHLALSDYAIGEIYHIADPCSLKEFVMGAVRLLGAPIPGHFPKWVAYTVALSFEPLTKFERFSAPLTISRVKALTSQTIFLGHKLQKEFDLPNGWYAGLQRTISTYQLIGMLP